MSEDSVADAEYGNPTQTAITDKQRARSERNRQRALLLRSARLTSHPYYNETNNQQNLIQAGGSRMIDSGAGFLIDPDDEVDNIITQDDLVQQQGK